MMLITLGSRRKSRNDSMHIDTYQ